MGGCISSDSGVDDKHHSGGAPQSSYACAQPQVTPNRLRNGSRGGNTLGGADLGDMSPRAAAAAAAEARAVTAAPRQAAAQKADLSEEGESALRLSLSSLFCAFLPHSYLLRLPLSLPFPSVGRITELYRKKRQEPPFALGSRDVKQLKQLYDDMKV